MSSTKGRKTSWNHKQLKVKSMQRGQSSVMRRINPKRRAAAGRTPPVDQASLELNSFLHGALVLANTEWSKAAGEALQKSISLSEIDADIKFAAPPGMSDEVFHSHTEFYSRRVGPHWKLVVTLVEDRRGWALERVR